MTEANHAVEVDVLSDLAHALVVQVIMYGCAKELARDPAAKLAFQKAKDARAQLLQEVNAEMWRLGVPAIDQGVDVAKDPFLEIRAIIDNHSGAAFGAVERRENDLRAKLQKAIADEQLSWHLRNFLQTILSRAESVRDDINALKRLGEPEERDLAERPAEKPRRILLVEDNPDVAVVTGEMLQHLGWQVTHTTNAAGALEAFSDEIDLLFSDVVLLGSMNGLELARQARQRRSDLPVVLSSGYVELVKRQAEEAGIPLLPKPYTLDTLEAALEAAQLHGHLADR